MTDEKTTALNEFKQARRQARRRQLVARLSGRDLQLLPFETIRAQLKQRNPMYRGIQQIPIRKIVGSVGRYREFNRGLQPLNDSLQARWVNVHSLATAAEGWPPIEVYQIGDVYFIKDGNHRASVAKAMGNETIEAHVWQFPEEVQIGPDDSLDEVLIRFGRRNFLEATHLDTLRPEQDIEVTTPGRFTELLAQIEDLQAQLSYIDRQEMPYAEAVAAWYDIIYLPVVQIIREAGLLVNFPERTETDLFVWLSIHRDAVIAQFGLDANSSLEVMARALAHQYKEGSLDKLARHVLRLFGQEAPPPWRILDQSDSTVTIEYDEDEQDRQETEVKMYEENIMLVKNYTKTRNFCRVTFKLPAEVSAETVHLVGDFNDWDTTSHPMKKLKDGSFSLTVSLPTEQSYRFRYLLDGERWDNDWAADAYVPNEFGSDDSLIKV
ncbi:MAG: hypothetical protein KC418_11265 [Anaerolineales bacterium]|nr:hypothetical protein [Anaerolineales bacterium]MCB8952314.1 hypothetical protein [Ardenticatenales bacterium]